MTNKNLFAIIFQLFCTIYKIMENIRYVLLIVFLSLTTTLKSQSYIKTIEMGAYIDSHISRPYYNLLVTNKHDIFLEIGMINISNSINLHFNSTIQQQAGNYRYMLSNIDEPFSYSNRNGSVVNYAFIGYSTPFRNYRTMVKAGTSSCKDHTITVSQNIRILGRKSDSDHYLDFNVHFKNGAKRDMLIFGYSAGINL